MINEDQFKDVYFYKDHVAENEEYNVNEDNMILDIARNPEYYKRDPFVKIFAQDWSWYLWIVEFSWNFIDSVVCTEIVDEKWNILINKEDYDDKCYFLVDALDDLIYDAKDKHYNNYFCY